MLLKLAIAALCLAIPSATAQTITIQTGERGADAAKISTLRVQTNINVTLPGGNLQTLEEQKTQQESVRRALYDMANRECRVLREVFGTDCRIVTMNATSNAQIRQGGGAETVTGNASITYELFPAAPRP